MVALFILLSLLVLFLIYAVIIIFLPVLSVEPQPIRREHIENAIPPCREDISFPVGGLTISGWLYLPEERTNRLPCVVMSHGFCGTRDFALEKYALRFVEEGYAVLTFDFRYFGDSEGFPRQLHCGKFQYEDVKAAIHYARTREEIDDTRVLFWGTSGGANYGIGVASADHGLAGVICQAGAYNHKEDNKHFLDLVGWKPFLKLFMHAQRDRGRARFGLSPHTFPPYGRPGTTSFLQVPGAFEGIEELAKESKTFKNEVCARVAFMPHPPDPLRVAQHVQCPVLIVVCAKDNLVSPSSHEALAAILGDKCKVVTLDVEHWDIYKGQAFEENVQAQLAFLHALHAPK